MSEESAQSQESIEASSSQAETVGNGGRPPSHSLHGWRLWLVRAGFLSITVLAVGLFLAGQSPLFERTRSLEMYQPDRVELVRTNLEQINVSPGFYAGYVLTLGGVLALVCLAIGLIIFYRRSSEPMALFVALLLVLLGATFGGAPNAAGDRGAFLQWLSGVLSSLSVFTVLMIFFLFPSGRFVPGWSRWPALVVLLAGIPVIVAPDTVMSSHEWSDAVYGLFLATMVITGIIAQVYRFRNISDYWQRQQTRWVVLGFAVALTGYLVLGLLPLVWTSLEPGTRAHLLAIAFTILFMLLIPLSFGVAILRYHLWDIDLVINRTLVYLTLTALLVGVYFSVVVALQSLFRAITGQTAELAIIISTLAVAALFQPARNQIQGVVDRRFYRRKYDASRILAAFGATARDEVDIGRLSAAVEQALDQAVQPSHVFVLVRNRSRKDEGRLWSPPPSPTVAERGESGHA